MYQGLERTYDSAFTGIGLWCGGGSMYRKWGCGDVFTSIPNTHISIILSTSARR